MPAKLLEIFGHFRVVCAEGFLENREGALAVRLGLGVLALMFVHEAQVFERTGHVRELAPLIVSTRL